VIERRRDTSRAQSIFVLLIIAIVVYLVWQFVAFQAALGRMPSGWTVAGGPATGLKPQQVIVNLRVVYSQTVTLRYRSETLTLAPQEVDFKLDEAATLQAMNDARTQVGTGARGYLYYLAQRKPPPHEIPAVTAFSEEKLRAFLTRVSERYDLAPTSPSPLIEEMRFVAGQPGTELDISASVPPIAAALRSVAQRDASLVVKTIPPVPPRLKLLRDLLETYLNRRFNGQAGVFIKDLQTGEEIGLNEGVAFSGLSLLKLPILTETYRRTSSLPDEPTLRLISQAATNESSNLAANTLLQSIGEGDAYTGADRLNASLRYLGLVNTFIAIPYDQNVTPPAVVTRANSRSDIFTSPDPRMQTTAEDMGLLLEMIYLCSRGGGTLMLAYPNAMTSQKCSQLLDLLGQAVLTDPNGSAPMFIRAGLPAGTRVANKWGFDKEVRANAGVVFTTNGDFVLVIFLRRTNWGDWQQASPPMADITVATYNYFMLPR
jgi:beta-lactamase class A